MACKIKENCCNLCGLCEIECANQAISESDGGFVIDPGKCTECVGNALSPRCAEVCNLNCPGPDPYRKEDKAELMAKWQRLHPGKMPATVYAK